jgi:poly(3-hydroxybutyrate) depolymerase
MHYIENSYSALLAALGLAVCATACGPSVIDLGAQGPTLADASAASSGSGGSASAAAGLDQPQSVQAGSSGALAMSGAGAGSITVQQVAGAAPPPPPPPDDSVDESAPDPSPGCGSQPIASEASITLNGASASYVLDLAQNYDVNRPYPLIISLRGAYVTAAAFRRYLDLPSVVGADGIVANLDCADGAATWDMQRDLVFFDALLEKLEADYCVDRRRIFVVGNATGALFASSVVCMRSGLVRGFGSLSGAVPSVACTERPAVWISQGNADMNVELGRSSRSYWVRQNQCNANMFSPVEPAPCIEYGECEPGRAVRYCEYDGTIDVPSFAAAGIWSFFKSL